MTYLTRAEYRKAWQDSEFVDPPVPLNLDLELASACNARCPFCLYGDSDWTESMREKESDGFAKRRFMPTDMAMRLIDEAHEIGIPAIKLNFRGESVIHHDYGMIAKYARSKGSFFDVLANTNGNIPNTLWDSSISGLRACTRAMVSLDSMDPETYPKVRVGLSLDSVKRTVDELVKQKHPDLWVRRVVCKDNRGEDFAGAVKERWPEGVKISEHSAFDRNIQQVHSVHGEDPTGWERTYCQYPSVRIIVEASGKYAACCIAWSGELSGGTYPQMGLMEYWNSPWRKKLAGRLRNNIIDSPKCRACTSFAAFKRPERNLLQDVEVSA